MSGTMKRRYKHALYNARAIYNAQMLKHKLAMLCGCVDDGVDGVDVDDLNISRKAISRLLSMTPDLATPVIVRIEMWSELEVLSNG